MKRIIAGFISVLMTIGCASADEIRLFDIPWDSDLFAVERAIDDSGFDAVWTYGDWKGIYLDTYIESNDSIANDQFTVMPTSGFVTFGSELSENPDATYDGISLANITVYCMFGLNESGSVSKIKPDARPYCAYMSLQLEQDEVDNMFEALTEDYKKKYGEYTEKWGIGQTLAGSFITNCDLVKRIFFGDNDTVASIEKTIYKGRSTGLLLVIGKLGQEATVKKLEEIVNTAE